MSVFKPSGIITLTTDFGHRGPFVATMKGVMLARLSTATIVDITHETDAHFPAEAGFWLGRAYPYFSPGTVHVGVVDPGVGTGRELIVMRVGQHIFVAPDNGLLAHIRRRAADVGEVVQVWALDPKRDLGLGAVSDTFHGRDVMAPIAAEIASGRLAPEQVGAPTETIVPSWIDEPQVRSTSVRGVVLAIDSFGNLLTNIEAEHLAALGPGAEVTLSGRTMQLCKVYADAKPGEYLALVNSFGVLEVAQAQRNAAESLGVGRGAPVVVKSR